MPTKKAPKKISLYDIKLSPAAIKQATDTLKSGWLSSGPKVAAFEKAIAEKMATRYAVAVGSATSGLQMVLTAIGAEPGKEVITTPFTFVATVEAIMATGATPVFADIDPHTLNLDADEVYRKFSRHTLAVMPVDIGGFPADYEILKIICKNRQIPLIADAAHSIGTAFKGRPVPRHTDAAVISFHATKNLICGEGGMVVSKHKAVVDLVRLMTHHGLTSSAHERRQNRTWEYDAIYPGCKANMSEVHAAIGLGQLTVFEKEQKIRGQLAERYIKNLKPHTDYFELPHSDRRNHHGWHLFILKLHLSHLKIDRNRFIELMGQMGVECGVHYKPVFELSFYRDALGLSPQYFPNTAYAGRRVITLPLYPSLAPSEVDYVCDCVGKIIKQHAR